MDLDGFWDATVGEYVRWDLWPAYLSAVLVWGLTSPLQDVVADGEASDNAVVEGGEHPHDGTEASPPDILDDFTAVEVFVVDVLRGLRTLSQRPAEASATTAPARAYHA
ncbi:hypothetical protein F442_19607 [Phytophthora nicotianae P10297]|uniref:Uncharacterized protein n=1 Tax=Phytophthora nicotianae P10297 TaxID=1317064 RepID=W2Y8X0_PHYNI|nr:hypothetical protein F442_19607 [Phytophthora nicotianae P10297]